MVRPSSTADFDVFYDDAMPIVYGYLVRLCGGDTEQAWDLTQDTWVAVVDQLQRGRSDCTTVPFVLTVARSRFLDMWRRKQRLQRKLRLVWAADRQRDERSAVARVGARPRRRLFAAPSDGADDGVRRRHAGGEDRRAARLLAGVGVCVAGQGARGVALTDHGRSVMNERYEDVRVAPDPARAEELRRRLHVQMTGSAPSRVVEIDEEVIVSQNPIRHRSRKSIYLAAAAVVVIAGGVVGIALATADSDDSPDNAPILTAPTITTPESTSSPATNAPVVTTTVRPRSH